MTAITLSAARVIIAIVFLPWLALAAAIGPHRRDQLLWGPVPIINNKYWSAAMRLAGWKSTTLVHSYYATINEREDFDLFHEDLVPRWLGPRRLRIHLGAYFAFVYALRHAAVVHIPFSGGALGETPLWPLEARLLRLAGVRTVIIPFGADVFVYSRVADPVFRSALLSNYPEAARLEKRIAARISHWSRYADVIVVGFTLDGLPRWDVPVGNMVCIDTDAWRPSTQRSGTSTVKVLHAPNHRGVKGTEFLIRAVEQLQAEGLPVELVLLERVPNEKVRQAMQEVDILADQFICPGYGLAAIEGMASGLPVLCNLEREDATRLFRLYSFLGECPIVSTSPETLVENLRALVTDPSLRRVLGQAGRSYTEKYHSYASAQYLFGSIYAKVLRNEDVDLMNLFHPLKSKYEHRLPQIDHPLLEGRLPKTWDDDGSPEPAVHREHRST